MEPSVAYGAGPGAALDVLEAGEHADLIVLRTVDDAHLVRGRGRVRG